MKKVVLSLSVFVAFALYVVATFSKGDFSILSLEHRTINTVGQTADQSAPPAAPPISAQTPSSAAGIYKDGQYTGDIADAYYGNVQVRATIRGGKISDVTFLDHPQDQGNSIRINNVAMPLLTREAIQVQSAQVDVVSGATATSGAFQQSLASALAQAQL